MTITNTSNKEIYVGDGGTDFEIPFAFMDNGDIQVSRETIETKVLVKLEYGTDYIIDDNKVKLNSPLSDDYKLIIMRVAPLTQERDYVENDNFPAESHEEALDKLTMITQQLQEQLDRSVKVGITSEENPDDFMNALNTAVSQANTSKTQSVEAKNQSVEAKNQSVSAKDIAVDAKNEAVSVASALANTKLRFMFEPIWSDHIIDSMSLLRADTFSWQNGNVYTAAYQELLTEFNDVSGTDESETIEGITINYRRTPKGYRIVDETQEANVSNLFNTVGVAWFYILDIDNVQFKLPRTKYNFDGVRNNVGGYVGESLPNIKGKIGINTNSASYFVDATTTGAFKLESGGGNGFNTNSPVLGGNYPTFDASRSSSAYQNNAPVQQRATEMYLYFYVGNTPINIEELNVGQLAEGLNGKADLTLNNASPSAIFKEASIGWGMPDYTAGISLTSGIEYTAEFNCFIYGQTLTNKTTEITVDGVAITASYEADAGLFVAKGSVFKLTDCKNPRQYPLKGVN